MDNVLYLAKQEELLEADPYTVDDHYLTLELVALEEQQEQTNAD